MAAPQIEGAGQTLQGTLTIQVPAPGILCTTVRGRMQLAHAQKIIAAGDEIAKSGRKIRAFHDWEECSIYEPEARQMLTDWAIGIRSQIAQAHVLVHSAMMRMGIAVASLLLKDMIVAHKERGPFESALAAALKEALVASRPPEPP
jgi:hypothetical protein